MAAAVPRAPLLLLLTVMAAPGCARDTPGLVPLSEDAAAFRLTARGEVLPARPYWAAATGSLRWGGPLQPLSAAECTADATPEAKIWREQPRIEDVRCFRSGGVLHSAWLASYEADGSARWRTSLLVDGAPADRVVGVSARHVGLESGRWVSDDGIVRDHLVPAHPARLSAPIAWSNDALVQVLDGDEARSLERIAMTDGVRQPLPPLPRAGWFSRWQVRDLSMSPDGRWLAAALDSDWRGPAPVAVAVLDLAQNRWVALETRCFEQTCQDPRVLAANDRIGFAYRDISNLRTNLITYSLPK